MIEYYKGLGYSFKAKMHSDRFIKILEPRIGKIFISKQLEFFYIDANSKIYFCECIMHNKYADWKHFQILDYYSTTVYMPLPSIKSIDDMTLFKSNIKCLYDANESIKEYFDNQIFE